MPGPCPAQHTIVSASPAWLAIVSAVGMLVSEPLEAVRAQAATARLLWSMAPPPGCVDDAAVMRTVEARLGRRVFGAPSADLTLDAGYAHQAHVERVELEVRSAAGALLGRREVSAPSCESLAAALPVVISVLLDVSPQAAAPEDRQPPSSTPSVQRDARLPTPRPALRSLTAGSGPAWRLSVFVQVESGMQPPTAAGAELGVSVHVLGPLHIGVRVNARLPSATDATPALLLQTSGLMAAACLVAPSLPGLAVSACARGGVAWLRAAARGVQDLMPDARIIWQFSGIAQLEYALAAVWHVALQVGVVVPVDAPQYGFFDSTGGPHRLFRPGPGLVSGIGISWLVP